MKRPKACLFDLDGVLLDTEPLHGHAWKMAARFFETELTDKQLSLLQGKRRIDCAKQILHWMNKPVSIEEFLSVHRPITTKLLSNSKVMPGAERLVRWCLANKLPIALVSSSSSQSVACKSSPHKWLELIEIRVLGDDPSLKGWKPKPDPFLLAAERIGIATESCWAIEDSEAGVQSALDAGCEVWVLNRNLTEIKCSDKRDQMQRLRQIHELNEVLRTLKNFLS